MSKTAKIAQFSVAQGEVSDYIEARVDTKVRPIGVRVLENFWNLPEGGATGRPGTKFLAEVKDSTVFTRQIPFEYSTEDAFILEFGNGYVRFFKNRARIMDGPVPYEITSPYLTADLRDIHYDQSTDFMFLTSLRTDVDIQKIARIEDDNWSMNNYGASPPPTFEADTDISLGTTTLTPAAVSGSSIPFVASAAVFYDSDVSRTIKFGASRALISSIDPGGTTAQCVITSPFPNTNPIAAGEWFLDGSPRVELDIADKRPVGKATILAATGPAFRAADVGKYIRVYEGIIQITDVNVDTVTIAGIILKELSGWISTTTPEDPDPAAAGSWRMEVASWSDTMGRPRTLAIHAGRVYFYSTPGLPSTLWGSAVGDIYNFGTGPIASDAIEYNFQHSSANPGQWLVSLISLYIGDTEKELFLRGQGVDKPITASEIPYESHVDQVGSAHVQPLLVENAILLIQKLGQDVVQMRYSLNESPDASQFVSTELTLVARHIGDMGFSIHRPIYVKKPFSMCFFTLDNGQFAGLTFKPRQDVNSWSRTVTGGEIESMAVVPHENGKKLTTYLIVKRVINGATRRYHEYFEDDDPNLQTRITDGKKWAGNVTDCNVSGTILAGASTITQVFHLIGETVDVILGDTYIGQKVVSLTGVVTLDSPVEVDTIYEVGLHYDRTLTTLRPNPPGEVVEGLKRNWPYVAIRVKNTIGGTINGKQLKKTPGGSRMFSGMCKMENLETEDPYDGALSIVQNQPYPMTITSISGTVAYGDTQS